MAGHTLSRWDLNDIMREEDIPSRTQDLRDAVAALEAYRAKLDAVTPEEFKDIVALQERTAILAGTLGSYFSLKSTEDVTDNAARSAEKQFDNLNAELANKMVFLPLWLRKLPSAKFDLLAKAVPHVSEYMDALRRTRAYALSEKEEQVVNYKDTTGVSALVQLYDLLEGRLEYPVTVGGKKKMVTYGELVVLCRSPNAQTREEAYRSMLTVRDREKAVFSDIYANVVRDWGNECLKLRGYASPIAVRNIGNNLPDAMVQTLLDVCRKNVGVFQRFFALKQRWLGLPKLSRYDIYAPLAKTQRTFSYGEAVKLVLDAYGGFSTDARAKVERIFNDRHVDSEVRKGKTTGAFCASVIPGMVPYVQISFTGDARDVGVLAHEMGHGLHDSLIGTHSPLVYHPTLPLAETASIFGEQLLLDHMLARESDDVKRELLVSSVDNAYASIIRQAYFVLFEQAAHDAVPQGATADDLAKTYHDLLREQFGPAMEIDERYRWEWTGIPHIVHTPFYCYAYAFGNLLTLALYERYKREGKSFVPKYMRFLGHGGSKSPAYQLREIGIDAGSEDFWQGGFDVIKRRVADLEQMMSGSSFKSGS